MSLASNILCTVGRELARQTVRRHRFTSYEQAAFNSGAANTAALILQVHLRDCSKSVRREVGAAMRVEFGLKG